MDHSIASTDKVIVKGIQFEAVAGLDCWGRPGKAQPIELEVHLTPPGGLEAAAQEDSVAYTIDYGKLYKALTATVFSGKFETITQLYQAIRSSMPDVISWHVHLSFSKAILAAKGGLSLTWTGQTDETGAATVTQVMVVRDIECRCIIGVNSHERLEKQSLSVTLSVWGIENRLSPSMLAGVSLNPSPTLTYQEMVKEVAERVEGSSYETIEALATAIAQIVTMGHGFDNARVTIEKPGGLAGMGASGVTIGRTKAYFENKDFWKVKRP